MKNSEYRELADLVDRFLVTRDRQTLSIIQCELENNKDFYNELVFDMIERKNYRYIQVFPTNQQIKLIRNMMSHIKGRNSFAYRVSWILPYVSNKVLNKVLSIADNDMLLSIMYEIKGHIGIIGSRTCDLPQGYWYPTTNVLSRMGERIVWHRIYNKCRKNLEK